MTGLATAGMTMQQIAGAMRGCASKFARPGQLLRYYNERAEAAAEYERGRIMAAMAPDRWEVFCVTTNEGRCRVISRPRGGWS